MTAIGIVFTMMVMAVMIGLILWNHLRSTENADTIEMLKGEIWKLNTRTTDLECSCDFYDNNCNFYERYMELQKEKK